MNKETTIQELHDKSDKHLADILRNSIKAYQEIALKKGEIGVTGIEQFKDASLCIAIQQNYDA